MNQSWQQLESSFRGRKASSQQPMQVLILYEDTVSGARGTDLYEQLLKRGPCDCSFETYRWDLRHPELLSALSEAVSMADMIIVSGDKRSHLPKEIAKALAQGLKARRVEDGAIVLVTDPAAGVRTALNESLLRHLASEFGLDFFSGSFKSCEERPLTFDEIHERAEKMTPTLERILQH